MPHPAVRVAALLILIGCEADPTPATTTPTAPTPTEAVNTDPMVVALYDGGGFAQLNDDTWVEKGFYGPAIYTEVSRDAWRVSLSRVGADGLVTLDYADQVILTDDGDSLSFNTGSGPWREEGWAVSRAVFDGGAFVQLDESTWVENDADGVVVFTEESRDGWTIVLQSNLSERWVLLDCWSAEIFTADEPDALLTLIAEIQSTGTDLSNGYTIRAVQTRNHHYVQVGADAWEVHGVDGAVEHYRQTGRDAQSVTLVAADDSSTIELNISQGEVISATDRAPMISVH